MRSLDSISYFCRFCLFFLLKYTHLQCEGSREPAWLNLGRRIIVLSAAFLLAGEERGESDEWMRSRIIFRLSGQESVEGV